MASGVYWSGEDKSVSSSAGLAWLGGEAAMSMFASDGGDLGAASSDQAARGTDDLKINVRQPQLCKQASARGVCVDRSRRELR